MKKHTDLKGVSFSIGAGECQTNSRDNYRKSLVPAPAVIPAIIRNIKFVAVKKLVVEFLGVLFCRNNLSAHKMLIRLLIYG